MKKVYLLAILCMVCTVAAQAQRNVWAGRVSAGATNVYRTFTMASDGNPVVAGGASEFGGGTPNGLVLMKHNKETGQQLWLKKYNGNTNSEGYKMYTDAQGNIYYFGTYTDYIAFGTDTLFTNDRVMWNRKNFVIAKFDASGNYVWAKGFGQKKFGDDLDNIVGASFTDTEFSAVIGFSSDTLLYNKNMLEALTASPISQMNYVFFKIDLSNGNLIAHKHIGKYNSSYVKFFQRVDDGTYEFGAITPASGEYEFVFSTISADGSAFTRKNHLNFSNNTPGGGYDIERFARIGDHYYMMAQNVGSSGYMIIAGDTLRALPTSHTPHKTVALVRFNSQLQVDKKIRYQYTYREPDFKISGNRIIAAAQFQNAMFIEGDSIIAKNNQHAWEVLVFDEDLQLKDTLQVNTNNSTGGGFNFRDAAADGDNIYTLFTHGKNIIYNDTTIFAAQKSWDHLTVLIKEGVQGNTPTGIMDHEPAVSMMVYPNPAATTITLEVPVKEMRIMNMTGQLVIKSTSQQTDISSLTPGLYFISATDGTHTYQTKFVKN